VSAIGAAVRRVDWVRRLDRSDEFRLFSRWFHQVCRIRERFALCMSANFDPLCSNETASVGFLAAAASRSGLLTLTDYVSVKRGGGWGAPYRPGRCDLWVADPDRELSWAFEFKQGLFGRGTRLATIGRLLDQACFDAGRVDRFEADHRYGGLIVAVQDSGSLTEANICLAQLAPRTSYCCRLGGSQMPVWVFLARV
jgi:hypothetical protein